MSPEAEGFKPLVNLPLVDGDDVEAGLGGDDAEIARLGDHAFEPIETWNEQVVKLKPFEILKRRGLPKMETAGVFGGRDEGEVDSGIQAEDAVFGQLPESIRCLLVPEIVFLPPLDRLGRQVLRTQQETQTFRPFCKTGFLAGEWTFPRWASISR